MFREKLLEEQTRQRVTDAINKMSSLCHGLSSEAGWWKNSDQGDINLETACTKLLLVITEIAEATEGLRKNSMDDKLPHRKMVEVELGDAIIRIFDLAGRMGLDLGGATYEKLLYNTVREDHKPENRAKADGKAF